MALFGPINTCAFIFIQFTGVHIIALFNLLKGINRNFLHQEYFSVCLVPHMFGLSLICWSGINSIKDIACVQSLSQVSRACFKSRFLIKN